MRLQAPIIGTLILILLIAIPVGGTPALQKGSGATYDLKAQILFTPPICEESPTSGVQPMIIACPLTVTPLPISTNITGTLGWSATSVSSTTAFLNVTRDVTISHDGLMVPDVHLTSSFNESINLATRLINLMPSLRTELDKALEMSQIGSSATVSTAMDPGIALTNVESVMPLPQHVYTMWWLNETVQKGQTVPVLVFPTEVIGAGSFEFQGKSRSTWTLMFNKTMPPLQQATSTAVPAWLGGGGFSVVFTFDYDQTSGLLLSAAFDVHMGFIEPLLQPSQCSATAITPSTTCNTSTNVIVSSGFSIHASLKLGSVTNLNLDSTLGRSGSTTGGTTGGSSSGSGPGGNGGSAGGTSGSGPGGSSGPGPSSGSNGGANGGSSPGSGSGPNSGGTPSGSSPQPASGLAPWIYLVLAAVVIAIVAVALLFAKRQSSKSSSQTTGQTK